MFWSKLSAASAVLASVALVAGVLLGALTSGSLGGAGDDKGTASLLAPPQSVDELLGPTQAVVLGRVEAIRGTSLIGSYNASDNARNELPGDKISPRIPATDYELRVESVLRATVPLHIGDTLILRVLGTPDARTAVFPMPRVGDHKMYFLSENPDHATYGPHFGPWSIIEVDAPRVSFGDVARSEIPFARGLTSIEFAALVRAHAR